MRTNANVFRRVAYMSRTDLLKQEPVIAPPNIQRAIVQAVVMAERPHCPVKVPALKPKPAPPVRITRIGVMPLQVGRQEANHAEYRR
jgi:hypothetical protein